MKPVYPGMTNHDMTLYTRYNPFWVVWLQNFKMCMLHRNFLQSVHVGDAYIFEYMFKESPINMGWKFFNYVKPKQD
jgi:hypothetical protein